MNKFEGDWFNLANNTSGSDLVSRETAIERIVQGGKKSLAIMDESYTFDLMKIHGKLSLTLNFKINKFFSIAFIFFSSQR